MCALAVVPLGTYGLQRALGGVGGRVGAYRDYHRFVDPAFICTYTDVCVCMIMAWLRLCVCVFVCVCGWLCMRVFVFACMCLVSVGGYVYVHVCAYFHFFSIYILSYEGMELATIVVGAVLLMCAPFPFLLAPVGMILFTTIPYASFHKCPL